MRLSPEVDSVALCIHFCAVIDTVDADACAMLRSRRSEVVQKLRNPLETKMNASMEPVQMEFEFMREDQRAKAPKWRVFEVGEVVQVKGIKFRVHEYGDDGLVLKFKR